MSLPGAWYDLSVRLHEARAVASCALEALPQGLSGEHDARANHASLLIAAVQDILTLMEKDTELIEAQMSERVAA